MVASCVTSLTGAASTVLQAYSGTSPPAFVEVAVTREPGTFTTSDSLVTAIKHAAETYTPRMDLSALSVEFQGLTPEAGHYVVARLRKAKP